MGRKTIRKAAHDVDACDGLMLGKRGHTPNATSRAAIRPTVPTRALTRRLPAEAWVDHRDPCRFARRHERTAERQADHAASGDPNRAFVTCEFGLILCCLCPAAA